MGTNAVRSRSPVHPVCALWAFEQVREQDLVLQRGQVYFGGSLLQIAHSGDVDEDGDGLVDSAVSMGGEV